MIIVRQHGTRFDDTEVARHYAHRAPYAAVSYEFLQGLVVQHRYVLDLGSGPGKIAGEMASWFERVDAVDSSLPMLRRGQALHAGSTNIRWIHARAEDAALEGPYDLVTIGAAAHWMDHAVVFPKLVKVMEKDGVLAMMDGDGPHQPPWQAAWVVFLRRWLERFGGKYDRARFGDAVAAYERWMDVAGRRTFLFDHRQSVADFVACQHSRATWTMARLGEAAGARFDQELTELLGPFAHDGQLEFSVQTNLVWGTPRSCLVEP
ncbi:MAG: methyltransferase domain-containing protein [Gammaproteobacteria bacterium]|nr:methyltransferase domain-containing protein [Gammaproteobacteria bacterium]